ncbi:MAG: sensor histidine kinase, partial [Lentisphaerota bacterium]
EKEYRDLNKKLEARVKERTARLETTVQQLQDLMEEHRRLEKLIQEFSEEERERIGRDIHDVLGQILTALLMKSHLLETDLKRRGAPEAATAHIIMETAQQAATQARNISRMLFPVELKNQDLTAALHGLCAFTEEMFNIECFFLLGSEAVLQLDIDTSTHVYRICQEAISNSLRHGHAQRIHIQLSVKNRIGRLRVSDNGQGIQAKPGSTAGRGLRIMKHRANMIGGKLSVLDNPGGGTLLQCEFPVDTKKARKPKAAHESKKKRRSN